MEAISLIPSTETGQDSFKAGDTDYRVECDAYLALLRSVVIKHRSEKKAKSKSNKCWASEIQGDKSFRCTENIQKLLLTTGCPKCA